MHKKFDLFTATGIVVASMVGTGVFTTLGFQASGLHAEFPILFLWCLGGFLAILGGLCYGELGAAFPRSGGEYNYLSKLYHPSLGFVSGSVSATIGFPAPIALSSIAFGKYLQTIFPQLSVKASAIALVLVLSIIQAFHRDYGKKLQNTLFSIKLCLLVVLIIAGFLLYSPQHNPTFTFFHSNDLSKILSPGFAIALIYASYAYSGWNSSTYIAGEIVEPEKNVMRSVLIGTFLVSILYILLNFVFLLTIPMDILAGKIEIGFLYSERLFGDAGGKLMSSIIALLLASSVSSLLIIGPRIVKTMGEDYPSLKYLSKENANGSPVQAIVQQTLIVIVFILTSSFEAVLSFIGFTLSMITTLTVAGIFIIRYKQIPCKYRTPAYPLTPLVYIALNCWMMYYLLTHKTQESLFGLAIIGASLILYFNLAKSPRNTTG
ncbi:MAG: amino acid permease [Spirochaetota bacterium]